MTDSKITYLRATSADFGLARQAVTEINLPSSHHTALDDAALAVFLADERHYLLLAVEEKRAVGSLYGYALLHPYRKESQFFLYGIDVQPDAQGRAIGTALVERFTTEAQQAGAFEVWSITNERNQAAMALFTRCGFRRSANDDVVLTLVPVPT